MQTDELRAELTELAREVDSFPGDLAAIRHRVARRRIALGSITALVSIALVIALVSVTHSNPSRIHVAGSVKEVTIDRLPRLDAVVVLPEISTDADATHVQSVLDSSTSVESYSQFPASTLARLLLGVPGKEATRLRARVCTGSATRSYGVALSRALRDPLPQITAAIGVKAIRDCDCSYFMR